MDQTKGERRLIEKLVWILLPAIFVFTLMISWMFGESIKSKIKGLIKI